MRHQLKSGAVLRVELGRLGEALLGFLEALEAHEEFALALLQ